MKLHFHQCSPSDIDTLVEISRKTFMESFEKDNNPEDFNNYVDAAFEKHTLSSQLNDAHSAFYFAFTDEQLVGYFKLNTNEAQTDIKAEEAMELERIYVLKDFQGKQIGQKMLQEALKIALQDGKIYMWLGVWEKNTNAIRFYQKHGFVKFGTHPYYIGNDKQTDWLMRFELSNFPEYEFL